MAEARRGRRIGGVLLGGLLLAGSAPAQDPAAEPPPPAVELDRLLQLPSSLDYSVETRGGDTPGEWRSRFRTLRDALTEERAALRDAEARMEEAAGSAAAWQVAPPIPGASANPDAPLDYQLRQEIKRRRAEIDRLERELSELEIEANLAGVPADWRE